MALTKIDDRGLKTPIDLLDNEKIRLGTGNDLEIYHDGTGTYLDNHTGHLRIRNGAAGNILLEPRDGEPGVYIKVDGATELYYNGSKKLETTSAGVKLLGSGTDAIEMTGDVWFNNNEHAGKDIYFNSGDKRLVYEDEVKAVFGGGGDLEIYHDGSHSYIYDTGTGKLRLVTNSFRLLETDNSTNMIAADENGAVELYYDGSKKFETTSTGATVTGRLEATSGIRGNDNVLLQLGTANDLVIFHDGSHSYVKDTGTGELRLVGNIIKINNAANNETMAVFTEDGSVDLYYNDSKKFETSNDGATVTGSLTIGDSNSLKLGNDLDAFIKHSGSDLFIENDTGGMNIKCTSGTGVGEGVITFSGGTGTEYMRMNNLGDLLLNQTSTNDSRLSIKQRSSAVDYINCRNSSNTLNMYCHSSGNLYNTNGNYSQISDQSLKENIVDAKSQWNDIKSIKIRNFNFTEASGMDTHTQIGCVAQEVETVSPKLVTAPRADGIKTVSNSVLYMKAVKALQEAMAKIEVLETKVAALEAA